MSIACSGVKMKCPDPDCIGEPVYLLLKDQQKCFYFCPGCQGQGSRLLNLEEFFSIKWAGLVVPINSALTPISEILEKIKRMRG